jgi:hypothetical protein
MKRIFLPIAQYPVYNDAVDRFMMDSNILNGGSDRVTVHSTYWDRKNIEYHLQEREGDDQGKFIYNGVKSTALIPFIEIKIKAIEDSYEKYKHDRIRSGYAEPTEMPIGILNELYLAKARLTVLFMEAEFLHKQLKEYKDKEEVDSDAMVLKYGLRCHGKLRDGILVLIDGQKVEDIDGVMTICDSRSPYDQLPVPSYRALAKKWQEDRKVADKERLMQMQAKCKAEGLNIPKQLPVSSMRRVNPSTFPSWPENKVNHLAEKRHRIRTV